MEAGRSHQGGANVGCGLMGMGCVRHRQRGRAWAQEAGTLHHRGPPCPLPSCIHSLTVQPGWRSESSRGSCFASGEQSLCALKVVFKRMSPPLLCPFPMCALSAPSRSPGAAPSALWGPQDCSKNSGPAGSVAGDVCPRGRASCCAEHSAGDYRQVLSKNKLKMNSAAAGDVFPPGFPPPAARATAAFSGHP